MATSFQRDYIISPNSVGVPSEEKIKDDRIKERLAAWKVAAQKGCQIREKASLRLISCHPPDDTFLTSLLDECCNQAITLKTPH
jgi:hypothetical protein